jgi:hypothetical protein
MSSNGNKLGEAFSPAVLELISGRELLIRHLGHWPTFHDFEVVSLTLDRPVIVGVDTDLRATFFVFDLYKAPDDPERKQGTAELLFGAVSDVRIDGFNHQNPIIGISIEPSPGFEGRRFRVAWGGTCMHHEVSFTCGSISVVRVVDLNPFRKSFPMI